MSNTNGLFLFKGFVKYQCSCWETVETNIQKPNKCLKNRLPWVFFWSFNKCSFVMQLNEVISSVAYFLHYIRGRLQSLARINLF